MNIGSQLTIGDSMTWDDDTFSDSNGINYTSAGYTLTWSFRSGTVLDITSTAKGNGWTTTISTAQSAVMTAGNYYWQAYATGSGTRVTAGTGMLKMAANLATAIAGFDGRTQTQKDYDAVTAEITARISGGVTLEYTIGSRSLKREPTTNLIALQSRLATMLNREKAAQSMADGLGNPRRVMVRFGA